MSDHGGDQEDEDGDEIVLQTIITFSYTYVFVEVGI